MLLLIAPHWVKAQGNWIEWLDLQAEVNGGVHGAYLPTRINASTSSGWQFQDTSVVNPGLHITASIMPIANKYVGFGWHWHRAEGYAAVSSHSIRQRGLSLYAGHPKLKFVYYAETVDRFVNIYRIEYGSSIVGSSEWFGRSAYEQIDRKVYGVRIQTPNTTELELQYIQEFWAGVGDYFGFGMLLNRPDDWQISANFFLNHPARGVNLANAAPSTPLPQASPMAILAVSKRLVWKSNYVKMAKYGL